MSTFASGGAWATSLDKRAEAIRRGMETAVKTCATEVQAEAMRTTPVRNYGGGGKGQLRKGWKKQQIARYIWEVGNDTPYAKYVEMGFLLTLKGLAAMAVKGVDLPEVGPGVPRFIKGRHMLGNAVHKFEPVMRRKIQEAVRRAL